jgi:nucleotide-binding universal stress UspA family protein
MRKIVVGIDGSDMSKSALRWAVDEARAHGAEVVALCAFEAPAVVPDLSPAHPVDLMGVVTEFHDGALQIANEAVNEVVGDDSSVKVLPAAVEDPPAKALIDAAAEADLLVVGSRGVGAVEGAFLGSVSQECAAHAPCPVLIHK